MVDECQSLRLPHWHLRIPASLNPRASQAVYTHRLWCMFFVYHLARQFYLAPRLGHLQMVHPQEYHGKNLTPETYAGRLTSFSQHV